MGETDEEIEAFATLASDALKLADPVPTEVSELAKIAFQFRDVDTAPFEEALTGTRSGSGRVTMQASRGLTTIIWSLDGRFLAGAAHSTGELALSVQTPTVTSPIEVSTDGAFEAPAPTEPFRILVDEAGDRWATPWSMP